MSDLINKIFFERHSGTKVIVLNHDEHNVLIADADAYNNERLNTNRWIHKRSLATNYTPDQQTRYAFPVTIGDRWISKKEDLESGHVFEVIGTDSGKVIVKSTITQVIRQMKVMSLWGNYRRARPTTAM